MDENSAPLSCYDQLLHEMERLHQLPKTSVSKAALARQHEKGRCSVWERLEFLTQGHYEVYWRNFGAALDGASIVTAMGEIQGRTVAIYGHDFTQRAGAMDAHNGVKLAGFLDHAAQLGVPVIGMNDSAGAYIQAGVGGLESYAKAFRSLRLLSGRVPSIMTMFGFNAGGGAYLPRQGSFLIQPQGSFFGLTGPGVVKSVLGEDVSAAQLGGPNVHSASGVTDYTAEDEFDALRLTRHLLSFLPQNSSEAPLQVMNSDPVSRPTQCVDAVLREAIDSPSGFQTPFDIRLIVQDFVDHGDYFEFQPARAQNMVCAFARLDGIVIGVVGNNSAVASGQIDCDAAHKATRFIRFCNLYNIPLLFLEDTTGFLPGQEQEQRGIVQAGRALLDAIVDVRVPRILLIVRNAYGGAYASFNNYATGADVVLALPTARIAVMGPAGVSFVYKDQIRAIEQEFAQTGDAQVQQAALLQLQEQYTAEFLNAREALRLGAVSDIVPPKCLRFVLSQHFSRLWAGYKPAPMQSLQREFV